MNRLKSLFIFAFVMLFSGAGLADSATDKANIRKALGDVPLESVTATAIPGLYEVVAGTNIVYVSADGRYMLQGELVDLKTHTSLTEPRRRAAQQIALESVGEDRMVVYAPEKVKHTITVFTDIDCGYCRKLHSEIDQYLAEGIKVRYLMYPRAGVDSDSYRKAVAVWCSEDRNASLTKSKAGKPIEMKTCDNPVKEHMELAGMLGLRGTPLIVLEDGQIQPGYVPAKRLAQMLDRSASTTP